MFTSDPQKKIKQTAVPTLFNVPNLPPKIGVKRRLPNRQETPPYMQGIYRLDVLLQKILFFHIKNPTNEKNKYLFFWV